jgi:hypothetical protein
VPIPASSSERWYYTQTRSFSTRTRDNDDDDRKKKEQEEDSPPPPAPSDSTKGEKLRDRWRHRVEEGRHRAEELRDTARERAGELRTKAERNYREFRDHPAESARAGARTVGGMLQRYGPVFVGTYVSVYFATLGALFVGVQSGLLDPVVLFGWLGHATSDATGETASTVQMVVQFMRDHAITRPYADIVENNPSFANLAVAWIAVKFTEPVRLPVALYLTPKVARTLGYASQQQPEDEEEEKVNSNASATTTEETSVKEEGENLSSSSSAKR